MPQTRQSRWMPSCAAAIATAILAAGPAVAQTSGAGPNCAIPGQNLSDDELLQCFVEGKLPPKMQHEMDAHLRKLQGQDRALAMSVVQRDCTNAILSNPHEVDALLLLGTTVPELCSCAASKIASALTAQEVEGYATGQQLPTRAEALWQWAARYCKVMLMR
jgi:hypothetical protein